MNYNLETDSEETRIFLLADRQYGLSVNDGTVLPSNFHGFLALLCFSGILLQYHNLSQSKLAELILPLCFSYFVHSVCFMLEFMCEMIPLRVH